MTQCPNCGAGLAPDGARCAKCGSVLRAAPAAAHVAPAGPPPLAPARLFVETKSAGLAFLLSLLVPGLGQLYNGEVLKGALFFLLTFATWFFCLGWLVHLIAAVEAMQSAKSFNRRATS